MSMHEREFSIWTCLDFCMEMLVLKSQTKGLDLAYNVDPSVPRSASPRPLATPLTLSWQPPLALSWQGRGADTLALQARDRDNAFGHLWIIFASCCVPPLVRPYEAGGSGRTKCGCARSSPTSCPMQVSQRTERDNVLSSSFPIDYQSILV